MNDINKPGPKVYELPWSLHGKPGDRWIASANGLIVLSISASAACPRQGDYYGCGGPEVTKRLNISEEAIARIVQCVNAHDELVTALREIAEHGNAWTHEGLVMIARDALANITGGAA